MGIREVIQAEAVDAYFSIAGNATLVVGTGVGKSKIAIDILNRLVIDLGGIGEDEIYLGTNAELLRDTNWEAEFTKFGAAELYRNCVVSECYQTSYKWEGKHFKVGIFDEVDFMVTPEYIKVLINNKFDRIVCMTGFLPPEKEAILSLYAPVCFRYATQDAQKDGVLNKTEFVFVEFNLSNERNIVVPKKTGGQFLQSEAKYYKYWDEKYTAALVQKTAVAKKLRTAALLGQATDELEKEVAKLEWQFKFFSSKRKTLLHTLESSRKVAQAVSLKIRADHPESKIIVFSALTSQVDKICKYTYHSKNKKNNPNIKMFNDGEFHILGAVDAINRGLNMVGVDYLIKESYIGSETKFQQQHGRGTRLNISAVMKFIILLPYYEDWVTYKEKDAYGRVINVRKLERLPTQACHWAVRMANSFDMSNSRTIVMNDDYTLPAGVSL